MSSQQGGERTEKATPKKRREARERGQIFKSVDLVTAFSLLLMFGMLAIAGGMIVSGLRGVLIRYLGAGRDLPDIMDATAIRAALHETFIRFIIIMLPVLGVAFAAGLIFNFLQVGVLFSSKAMQPQFSRISMIQGFKRIFSKKTVIDLLKSLVRLTVIVKIGYDAFMEQVQKVPALMEMDIITSAKAGWGILLTVGFRLAIALAILGPIDYFLQWRQYEKDLMMTKQEVLDEYKLTEGDPKIKGRIRQKQRQMSSMRMMQAVSQADVVITNPTHFAVALSYKEGENNAPVIVAKGQDYLAKKIREKAAELKIEIVENKAVARHLYYFCEIGDEVPEEMYQAVAEILAYVYRLKHPQKGR
jgi:flagellar biosynthetic protein FlhB